jgi:hypothetical protein
VSAKKNLKIQNKQQQMLEKMWGKKNPYIF